MSPLELASTEIGEPATSRSLWASLFALDPAGVGWRACFLLNVPIGAIALALARVTLSELAIEALYPNKADTALRLMRAAGAG
jgi:hypothetical protein